MTTEDEVTIAKEIRRAGLKRTARIGDLYDVRNESFVGTNLLKDDITDDDVSTQKLNTADWEFVYEDSTHNRSKAWGVSASVSLGFWGISTNITASYASQSKSSSKATRVSAVYKTRSLNERVYFERLKANKLHSNMFKDGVNATHVVTSIDWGANCAVICEHDTSSDTTKTTGEVKADFKYLMSVDIKADADMSEEVEDKASRYSFSCKSDVAPDEDDELPLNFSAAMEFVTNLPSLMGKMAKDKEGNPKGIPSAYYLTPLSAIAKIFKQKDDKIPQYVDIDHLTAMKVGFNMEKITEIKQRIYYLQNSKMKDLSDEALKALKEANDDFQMKRLEFLGEYEKALLEVRSNKAEPTTLTSLVETWWTTFQGCNDKLDEIEPDK